jgi:hypothetical protein
MRPRSLFYSSKGIEEDESSFLGAFPEIEFLFPILKSHLCYPWENIQPLWWGFLDSTCISGRIFNPL